MQIFFVFFLFEKTCFRIFFSFFPSDFDVIWCPCTCQKLQLRGFLWGKLTTDMSVTTVIQAMAFALSSFVTFSLHFSGDREGGGIGDALLHRQCDCGCDWQLRLQPQQLGVPRFLGWA